MCLFLPDQQPSTACVVIQRVSKCRARWCSLQAPCDGGPPQQKCTGSTVPGAAARSHALFDVTPCTVQLATWSPRWTSSEELCLAILLHASDQLVWFFSLGRLKSEISTVVLWAAETLVTAHNTNSHHATASLCLQFRGVAARLSNGLVRPARQTELQFYLVVALSFVTVLFSSQWLWPSSWSCEAPPALLSVRSLVQP